GPLQAPGAGGERVLARQAAALDRRRRTGAAPAGAGSGSVGPLPRRRLAGRPAASLRGRALLRPSGGGGLRDRTRGIAGRRPARARTRARWRAGDSDPRRDRGLLPATYGRVAPRRRRVHRRGVNRTDDVSRDVE